MRVLLPPIVVIVIIIPLSSVMASCLSLNCCYSADTTADLLVPHIQQFRFVYETYSLLVTY